jgi:hypothetical protein
MLLSEGIGGTLEVTDLTLQNLTTGTIIPSGNISAVFNALSNEVVFRFPSYAGGVLPDGNYLATLGAGSLSDTAGNLIDSPLSIAFFVLAGDANRDRAVGFADLVAVAQHYGTTGDGTYATGDFDYDGNIGFSDLVTVAQNYGKTLPAAAPPVPALALFTPATKPAPLTLSDDDTPSAKTLFSTTPISKAAATKPVPPARPAGR